MRAGLVEGWGQQPDLKGWLVSRRGGDKSPRIFRIFENLFQNCLAINSRSPLMRLKLRRGSLFKGNGCGTDGPGFCYQTGPEIAEWRILSPLFCAFALPLSSTSSCAFLFFHHIHTEHWCLSDTGPGSRQPMHTLQGPIVVGPDFSSSASSPLAALCTWLAWGQMSINQMSQGLKLESGILDSRLLSTSSMLPLFRCSTLRSFCPL